MKAEVWLAAGMFQQQPIRRWPVPQNVGLWCVGLECDEGPAGGLEPALLAAVISPAPIGVSAGVQELPEWPVDRTVSHAYRDRAGSRSGRPPPGHLQRGAAAPPAR